GRPDLAGDARGDRTDHVVAGRVPVGVVDLLEVVDVQHHGDHRPDVPAGFREVACGELEEAPAVGDAGQLVDGGEFRHPREQARVVVRGDGLGHQRPGDLELLVRAGVDVGRDGQHTEVIAA